MQGMMGDPEQKKKKSHTLNKLSGGEELPDHSGDLG